MVANIAIKGGLGNQLFQYAFGEFLKKEYGFKIKYDLEPLTFTEENLTNRKFELQPLNLAFEQTTPFTHNIIHTSNKSVPIRLIAKLIRAFLNIDYIEERGCELPFINKKSNYYFDGYWQNSQYAGYLINKMNNMSAYKLNQMYLSQIRASQHNIGIHIRRGDYVNNPFINNYHGSCELEYFYEGIAHIKRTKAINKLFIFSDDINWVKNNFKSNIEKCYIEPDNHSPLNDLMLLKSCNNLIISNSSFSAWASYLIGDPNAIIIAPQWWTRSTETLNLKIKTDQWTIL